MQWKTAAVLIIVAISSGLVRNDSPGLASTLKYVSQIGYCVGDPDAVLDLNLSIKNLLSWIRTIVRATPRKPGNRRLR